MKFPINRTLVFFLITCSLTLLSGCGYDGHFAGQGTFGHYWDFRCRFSNGYVIWFYQHVATTKKHTVDVPKIWIKFDGEEPEYLRDISESRLVELYERFGRGELERPWKTMDGMVCLSLGENVLICSESELTGFSFERTRVFGISRAKSGPFLKLPCKQEEFFAQFGEPLEWKYGR